MPGAVYRNSSSGRKEANEKDRKGDNHSSHGQTVLPPNLRLAQPATVEPRSTPEPAAKEQHSPARQEKKTETPSVGGADGAVRKKSRGDTSRPQEKEDAPRAWHVRLTPSIVLMLSVLLLVTLAFFFLFGLIVGRGTVPPPHQPQLERLLPEGNTSPEAPERILPEEDLRFMTSLKTDNPSEASAPLPKPASNGRVPQPTGQNTPNVSQAMPAAAEVKPDNTKYDFVVRAAAFKSEEKADDLRARLEGSGIRTRLVREKAQKGTWYYVQILYRGTEDGLQKLRDGLGKFAIKDTILASKKPVN